MKPSIKKCDPVDEYYFAEGCYITEVSNSTDDLQLSIARARVEPGKTTRWHYLQDITERYVILKGSGMVEVGDLEPQLVTACDVVIIPPGERQRITNSGEDDLTFLAICSPRFEESLYFSV
jgi:mannose-6-phosphate isomerase-like protein (cupin superfamily)